MGELESPSVWKVEFRENPERHVVLLSVNPESSKDVYFGNLSARVKSSKKNEALVFVHGYNVSFSQAARRTAQLAYDLAFDGPAILYSCPSVGKFLGYTIDEANIEWTTAHLAQFLEELAEKAGVGTLHLVGHSMGNRAVSNALNTLATRQTAGSKHHFRQVILTAPDIDAGVFLDNSHGPSVSQRIG